MSEAEREMPRYQCHKVVHALKIAAIQFGEEGHAGIVPADDGYAPFDTSEPFRTKFHGSEEDLGYFVVYADGYVSWSPTKAFEEGYTRI